MRGQKILGGGAYLSRGRSPLSFPTVPRASSTASPEPSLSSHHDRHACGGIPLPNHPLLPPVCGPGGGRGDAVPGGVEGSAYGQCTLLRGEPGV